MADRDDIVAHHMAGTLPQLIVERVRGHLSDEIGREFREAAEALHNTGTIDLLESARAIATSPIGPTDFFVVQTLFVGLIPKLDAEVPPMMAAVKALVARAGDDLASGAPYGAYRSWAEVGDRALTTLAAINPEDPTDSPFVLIGLLALAKSMPEAALDRAIRLLAESHPSARSAAAKAVGTLPLATSEARARAANALTVASTSSCDDNLRGNILAAICEMARTGPDMEASALALIAAAAPEVGDQAIHQVSLQLMFHGKDLSPTNQCRPD